MVDDYNSFLTAFQSLILQIRTLDHTWDDCRPIMAFKRCVLRDRHFELKKETRNIRIIEDVYMLASQFVFCKTAVEGDEEILF
jgi:hypothetical protein